MWVFTFSARMEGHHFIMLPCMDVVQGLKLFFKTVMVIYKINVYKLQVIIFFVPLALLSLCHT